MTRERIKRIKRLINKPIDVLTTAIGTIGIFAIIYAAMIPYLLGKRSASTDHGHADEDD